MNKEKFIKDQINKKLENLEKNTFTIRGTEYIMLFDSKVKSVPITYNTKTGDLFVDVEYFMFRFFGINTNKEIEMRPWLSYLSQLFNSLTGYTPTVERSIGLEISRSFYDKIKDLM